MHVGRKLYFQPWRSFTAVLVPLPTLPVVSSNGAVTVAVDTGVTRISSVHVYTLKMCPVALARDGVIEPREQLSLIWNAGALAGFPF